MGALYLLCGVILIMVSVPLRFQAVQMHMMCQGSVYTAWIYVWMTAM